MTVLFKILSSPFAQTAIITIVTIVLTQIALAKGRLRWANRHQHSFLLPNAGPNGTQLLINTREIWVTNTGRAAVEDIEIVFNWEPQHFEIWNPREYSQAHLLNGRFSLKVPTLAGKEFFSVALLSTAPLPEIVNVRSKNSIAKPFMLLPTRQFPTWFNVIGLALLILGMAIVIYGLVVLASLLWAGSPPPPPKP
ncbi:hypothetical protein RJJ65_33030 [Rhizobium hidalgonense]|uniref:Uncharacterized protein n=1 Tax=Rhizobium hidalgonense TaxID=1538159 RepID=A0A2A6KB24_9HYPH|nr:hypothetical protein [Rhizobium hidalgonense]MDR9777379.1 hypothetical protein [Rhizobium hidalgonense]MDR9812836.1 hypothetical protein [Rhizobium hidalgonense]MDR9821687.1 hypothetical protein [Rhizobium hidalgonense]PDT21595.1 hypothetical protein CO674_21940 [Rhizobium hidalgonense]PON08248.1 hypothetical protein ATY29_07610 [Rhizobium hidalgonense]